jgi:hypothetical protein
MYSDEHLHRPESDRAARNRLAESTRFCPRVPGRGSREPLTTSLGNATMAGLTKRLAAFLPLAFTLLICIPGDRRAAGATVETEHPQPGVDKARIEGDRFSITFGDSSGRDLRDGRRILTSRQLSQGANWRHEAGFGLTPVDSDNLKLSVSGGLYDARRPDILRQQKLHLGKTESWRKHQGMDLGLNLELFGNRLRYAAGYAWSNYIETDRSSRNLTRSSRRTTALGWQSDDAQRHRIDVDILRGGPIELSAYGLYQSGGGNFRQPPRSGMPLPLSIGEASEFGASLDLDKFSLDIRQRDQSVGERDRRKTEGKIAYNPVTLSVFQQETSRTRNGRTQRREDTSGGAVKVDLEKLRQGKGDDGFSLRRLLPSSVTVGTERSQIQYGARENGQGTGVRLGLYWAWEQGGTDISVYRKNRVIGSSGIRETDYGLDFSHTAYGGTWDATAYLSLGGSAHDETDNRHRDFWVAGGVSASYYGESFPDVRLSLDFNRYDGAYPDFDERFGDQAVTLDLAVDLSKYLSEIPAAPSLKLHYYAFPNRTWDSYTGRSGKIEHAIGVTMAVGF